MVSNEREELSLSFYSPPLPFLPTACLDISDFSFTLFLKEIYMCNHVCRDVLTHVCIYGEQKSTVGLFFYWTLSFSFFSPSLPPIFPSPFSPSSLPIFWTKFLTKPRAQLFQMEWLTNTPLGCLALKLQMCTTVLSFITWLLGTTWMTHVWAANTLPMEHSPQPCIEGKTRHRIENWGGCF